MRKLKAKPELKVSDDILALRDMDTNIIAKKLEDDIKLREMSVEEKIKKKLLK